MRITPFNVLAKLPPELEPLREIAYNIWFSWNWRAVELFIRMDAEFGRSMLYVTNADKPGFIGRFASLLGDAQINIATFNLGRDAEGGNAIALVEIDGEIPPDILDKVRLSDLLGESPR